MNIGEKLIFPGSQLKFPKYRRDGNPFPGTYTDLKKLLFEIMMNRGTAFKINLGFGFMLYDLIAQEFRYFYVSSNNLLFDVAFTVSTKADVDELMKRIIDLALRTNYYMKRPSSGWMLAGMPNVEIKIFYLKDVPLG